MTGWVPRFLAVVLPLLLACGELSSSTQPDSSTEPDSSTGADSGTEADASDGAACAPGIDGSTCEGGTFDPILDNSSKWSTFDTATINPMGNGYMGAAFDGRYVYFAPNTSATLGGLVARYDTQAPLASPAAWSTFDTIADGGVRQAFAGAVFDGRYVYFVPYGGSFSDHPVTRYDTQAAFTSGSSWSTFDVVTAGPTGFNGGVFDGRYVYFVGTTAARYDTMAPFAATASWSTFDLRAMSSNLNGFTGGVFDGRYIYLVPAQLGGATAVRYDTQAAFAATASWSMFDVTSLSPLLSGTPRFAGAAFDGRYVYFVPADCFTGCSRPPVVRYDTLGAFASSCSWSTFDVWGELSHGATYFGGAAFDGRYVYFVPSSPPYYALTRYDTQAPFTWSCSWSTFDVSTLKPPPDSGIPPAPTYWGGAFDGRYLYLGPLNGVVARFDAKSPPGLPPGPAHGSFF